jgi:glycine dehydrogenase
MNANATSTLAGLACDDPGFAMRHIGSSPEEQQAMLAVLGFASRAQLVDAVVPAAIRRQAPLDLPPPLSETEALARLRSLASRNRVLTSFIGQG